MKTALIAFLSLVIFFCGRPQVNVSEAAYSGHIGDGYCEFAIDLPEAIKCAHVAKDISSYNGEWPAHTNSTMFFKLIEGNLNLKSLNFCGVYIDSLTSSIGHVSNLESLQLSSGNIRYIPKGIGNLKKLKSLILGTSKDECGGNKVSVVPKEIGKCQSLEYLGLAYSEVVDLPKELASCQNLKIIELSGNKVISAKAVAELRRRFPKSEILF